MEKISDKTRTPSKANGSPIACRTLLLSPPSLSSNPDRLDNVLAAHDRNATDIQMLDRLSLSLVSLPQSSYDTVLILLDADNSRTESKKFWSGDLLSRIVRSLKPGGKFSSEDGRFGIDDMDERREAVFAGLTVEGEDMIRPNNEATQSVPLRSGKKKSDAGAVGITGAVSLKIDRQPTDDLPNASQPVGVGFVDSSHHSDILEVEDGSDGDDELIDEDTLLDEEDMKRPIIQREFRLSSMPSARQIS